MYEYCIDEFIEAVNDISYDNCKLIIIDNSKDDSYQEKLRKKGLEVKKLPHREEVREMLIEGHNLLKHIALKEGYDYLFILDQDVIVPFNILKRLLEHKKKITTGLYYNFFNVKYPSPQGMIEKNNVLMPVLYKQGSELSKVKQFSPEEVREPQLLETRQCGTGCLLIHKDVLKKIEFRYVKDNNTFDDTWFCLDAIKAGFKIFCDTSMKCKHRIFDKDIEEKVWKAK